MRQTPDPGLLRIAVKKRKRPPIRSRRCRKMNALACRGVQTLLSREVHSNKNPPARASGLSTVGPKRDAQRFAPANRFERACFVASLPFIAIDTRVDDVIFDADSTSS